MQYCLIINPNYCGSGDTRKGKIYPVLEDKLVVTINAGKENENLEDFEYNSENMLKYKDMPTSRYITIQDESDEDEFEINGEDDAFIFENEKELSKYLIDNIDGLAQAVTNLYKMIR